jgi:3-deoxy-D-manno-octulosonic-acid transferase
VIKIVNAMVNFFWRWFLQPLATLLSLVFPQIQKRKTFEKKNLIDPFSQSFRHRGIVADVCFEVSSEGELQQSLYLIESFLSQNFNVEILFSSPSVETQLQHLADLYLKQVTILRLPLVDWRQNSLDRWVTASALVLCRYDFYPQILALVFARPGKTVLLSATLKNKHQWPLAIFYKNLMLHFSQIYFASEMDLKAFQSWRPQSPLVKPHLEVFDFRTIKIMNRLKDAQKKLVSFSFYPSLINIFKHFPKQKMLIIGNAWPWELDLWTIPMISLIKEQKILVVVVPHILDSDLFEKLKIKTNLPWIRVDESTTSLDEDVLNHPFLYLSLKGILCELYSFFGHALVGGGHGRSVHSLLEPYLAGAHVYCGPKVHRSTEYDYIHGEGGHVTIVDNLVDFVELFKKARKVDENQNNKGHDFELCQKLTQKAEKIFVQIKNDLIKIDMNQGNR